MSTRLPGSRVLGDRLSVQALITSNDSTFNIPGHSTTSQRRDLGLREGVPVPRVRTWRFQPGPRDGDASPEGGLHRRPLTSWLCHPRPGTATLFLSVPGKLGRAGGA